MGKICYSNYEMAEGARKISEARAGIDLRVYKCPYCHQFHLTSKTA